MSDTTDTTENKREAERVSRFRCCILIDFMKLLHGASFSSSDDLLNCTSSRLLNLRCRGRFMMMGPFRYKNDTTLAVTTFGDQTDKNSIIDTWAHEQGNDVINKPVAITEHLKYVTTVTLNCEEGLTFENQANKTGIMDMKKNEQEQGIFINIVAPVEHMKYMTTEIFDCKTGINFDSQIDDVCADAAAAITITYRDTYTFDRYMSDTGNAWVPIKSKNFQTKTCLGDFSTFPVHRLCGMVGWQIANYGKPKHNCKNKKHAFRFLQQQQREATALELNDAEFIGDDGSHTTEGTYNDLSDGRYKKTKYVKRWTGKTVSVEADLNRNVEAVMKQLETKTRIPKDHQHLVSRGKVLKDNRMLKDYGISVCGHLNA